MGILGKIESFLSGKKTYIVALLTGILGILGASGYVIPEYVWALLAAAGLGAVRSSVGTK